MQKDPCPSCCDGTKYISISTVFIMTDGAVPAITLTNPHNKNAEFSPELSPPSPVKSAESVTSSELNDVKSRGVVFGRPGTATSTHESVVSNSMSSRRRRMFLCLLSLEAILGRAYLEEKGSTARD